MKSLWIWLILLGTVTGGLATTDGDPPQPEPVGVTVTARDGVTVLEAVLPGELVDWTRTGSPQGGDLLALLVELDTGAPGLKSRSWQVLRWHLSGAGELVAWGPPLNREASSVLAVADPEGSSDSLLVVTGGELLRLDNLGSWRSLYLSRRDLFPVRAGRGGPALPANLLVMQSAGHLEILHFAQETGRLQLLREEALTLTVDREWGGLVLESPRVWALPQGDGRWEGQWIVGPETRGLRRLRTTILRQETSGSFEWFEAWNMLPNREQVEESWYLIYRGEPVLIVTTVMADKHGVFEKKKLRLFNLATDRTRSGSGPRLEVMTRTRNWYETCFGVADVDADGIDDIVSLQPKGLGGGSLWIEAYLGRPDGGFRDETRSSEIAIEEGETCILGARLAGTRVADLVVVEGDSILVFPLVVDPAGSEVVPASPLFRIPFASIDPRPELLDTMNDDPDELVVTGHTQGGRAAISVVRFP